MRARRTSMGKYGIVDADCHILEPPDLWKTWLPKKFQDMAPKLVKDVDGGDAWQHAGAPDPTRLIAVGQIPSIGIDTAVDYIRKLKARGVKAVLISNWPSGGESISDADDAFWAAAQDEGVPVCIHINLISRKTRQAQR